MALQNRETLYAAIENMIDKTICEDISHFYQLKTTNLIHLKRILNFLASIPPGKVNTNNLARHLQIDNKTIDHYLMILQRTEMISFLYPAAHGNQILRKPAHSYAVLMTTK